MNTATVDITRHQVESTIVDRSEMVYISRNKWLGVIQEQLEKLATLKDGQVIKLGLKSASEVQLFLKSLKKYLNDNDMKNVEFSGSSKRLCAFIGKK